MKKPLPLLVLAAGLAAIAGTSMAEAPPDSAALPQPMLGQPAPDFRLKDLKGKTVSLASLEGKIVVLHFGASW